MTEKHLFLFSFVYWTTYCLFQVTWPIPEIPYTQNNSSNSVISSLFAALIIFVLLIRRFYVHNQIYLISSAVFEHPNDWKLTHEQHRNLTKDIMKRNNEIQIYQEKVPSHCTDEEIEASISFMKRLQENSAIGDSTALPPNIRRGLETDILPSIDDTKEEFIISTDKIIPIVLREAGLTPRDITILIVNSSWDTPTPSHCAQLIIRHKLDNKQLLSNTYNLGGMGCSANLISLDLATKLLTGNRGDSFFERPEYCLVVSMDPMAQKLYPGNDKSFLISNCIFRSGACAQIYSNSPLKKPLMVLTYLTRLQNADALETAVISTDSQGVNGLKLDKNLVRIASDLIDKNYGITCVDNDKSIPIVGEYITDAKKEFETVDKWCVHAGGRAVIEAVRKLLGINDVDVMASMRVLRNMGNVCSSSVWYEMKEHINDGVESGMKVAMIALGSGFKCNIAHWLTL